MQRLVGHAPAVASWTRSAPPPPSFDQLFTRYQGPIYRHILGLVGDPAQAQDLTQDTFLKVFTALPGAHDPVRPAWLYRIATNTARDALRHRRRLTWVPFAPGDDDRLPAPDRDLPTHLAEHEAVRHAPPARLPAAARPRRPLHHRDRPRHEPVARRRQDDARPRQRALPRRLHRLRRPRRTRVTLP